MPERTTPAERPPYWSDCENMTILQLGRFIYDALRRRSKPKVPTDGSTPLSRREFSDLVGLMEAKADEQTEDTTMPARPVYEGSAVPPLYSYPFDELEAARSRRDRALERLEDAIRHRRNEGRVQHLHADLRKAERELP